MDQLPQLGTAISSIVASTYRIYAPLLLKQEDNIRSTHKDSFSYGPNPRQQLDIYSPPPNAAPLNGKSNSVLVFLYGGGLVMGGKTNEYYLNGLVYANLGHYFSSSLGIPVAIVDYRLLSHGAKFPSGGEDLKLALDWISQHFASGAKCPLNLFIMGNSAGAVHTCTYLLAEEFRDNRHQLAGSASESATLKGVILIGTPFHFEEAHASRSEVLNTYYGPEMSMHCPIGLLRTAKSNGSIEDLAHVNLLVLTSSLDPEDEVVRPGNDFVKEWRSIPTVASNLTYKLIEGHNHISPVLGVGTGVPAEESWGRDVADFIVKIT